MSVYDGQDRGLCKLSNLCNVGAMACNHAMVCGRSTRATKPY